jgi:hypothetical protein
LCHASGHEARFPISLLVADHEMTPWPTLFAGEPYFGYDPSNAKERMRLDPANQLAG